MPWAVDPEVDWQKLAKPALGEWENHSLTKEILYRVFLMMEQAHPVFRHAIDFPSLPLSVVDGFMIEWNREIE